MKLHIFNPEHDIALASGLANFTAPHAGRQLRYDMGFLPALWADAGDVVLTDDAEHARKGLARVAARISQCGGSRFPQEAVTFCSWKQLKGLAAVEQIVPWGWDAALHACLARHGAALQLLPSAQQLDGVRQLSHRRVAAALLADLCSGLPDVARRLVVGQACECRSAEEVEALLHAHGQIVVKAPWSSSGRGVRFLSAGQDSLQMQAGWLKNVLAAQGSVMAEPYYNKVRDFGMEFSCDASGLVSYEGLSLFSTQNGAYTGNVMATEASKRQVLGRYVPMAVLEAVQTMICLRLGEVFRGGYSGCFGVDMMIVAGENAGEFLLHPCVEINLRQTMGHVALRMERLVNAAEDDDVVHVMRMECSNRQYRLRLQKM